jgi:hypothetical protein
MNTPLRVLTPLLLAALLPACTPAEKPAAPTSTASPAAPQATEPATRPATQPVQAPEGANAGTRYVYGVVGAIDSSRARVLEAEMKRAIDAFQALEGRLPRNLDELVSSRTIPALPTLPEGTAFEYDPATGRATVVVRRP